MMDNLSDAQRFSFIGIILGIPIIILTLFFISNLNQDIKWTDDRLQGVQYSKLLKDLLQDVQQHRGLSISYLNGNEQKQLQLEEKQFDIDRKSTRLNSSHVAISYAVFCL